MFNCCLNDDILTHSMLVVAKQTECKAEGDRTTPR